MIVNIAKGLDSLVNDDVSVVTLDDALQKSLYFLVVGLRISHLAKAVADLVLKELTGLFDFECLDEFVDGFDLFKGSKAEKAVNTFLDWGGGIAEHLGILLHVIMVNDNHFILMQNTPSYNYLNNPQTF